MGHLDTGREDGLSLVELLVAMSVLLVTLASVYGLLFSVQNGVERQIDRSTSLDQARLALQQIDREIRSASAFTTSASGMELVAYTRTNQVAVSGGSARATQMCVQWQVDDGNLQTRMWPLVGAPAEVPWRTTATDIVNSSATPLFVKPVVGDGDDENLYNGRLLNVRILANSAPTTGPNVAPNVEIESSLSGRNVNGSQDPCAEVIADGDAPG